MLRQHTQWGAVAPWDSQSPQRDEGRHASVASVGCTAHQWREPTELAGHVVRRACLQSTTLSQYPEPDPECSPLPARVTSPSLLPSLGLLFFRRFCEELEQGPNLVVNLGSVFMVKGRAAYQGRSRTSWVWIHRGQGGCNGKAGGGEARDLRKGQMGARPGGSKDPTNQGAVGGEPEHCPGSGCCRGTHSSPRPESQALLTHPQNLDLLPSPYVSARVDDGPLGIQDRPQVQATGLQPSDTAKAGVWGGTVSHQNPSPLVPRRASTPWGRHSGL